MVLIGLFLFATQASAQQKTVTGKVTNEQGTALSGVAVLVKGTTNTTTTNVQGTYSIRADVGQVLQFRTIGAAPIERAVVIDREQRSVPAPRLGFELRKARIAGRAHVGAEGVVAGGVKEPQEGPGVRLHRAGDVADEHDPPGPLPRLGERPPDKCRSE